jgi:hypothetical protein
MCAGGNFFVAAIEIGNGWAGSMDYDSTAPYMSAMWQAVRPTEDPIFIAAKTAEFVTTPLNPVHLV